MIVNNISDVNQLLRHKRLAIKKIYCPVFKVKCKTKSCMSYYDGTAVQKGEKWEVYPPICTCVIVTGIIEVDPIGL